MSADKIFHGGDIITVDRNDNITEALAVSGETIIAVGKYDDVIKHRRDVTEMIDLAGKTVMPGFVSARGYPLTAATIPPLGMINVDDLKCSNLEDLLAHLMQAADKKEEGQWIIAYDFDPMKFNDEEFLITKQILDEKVSRKHPVMIGQRGFHLAFVNSMALNLNNMENLPNSGSFHRDDEGEKNGMITEPTLIGRVLYPVIQDKMKLIHSLLPRIFGLLSQHGYTTVADGHLGLLGLVKPPFDDFQQIADSPDIPIRLLGYAETPFPFSPEMLKNISTSAVKGVHFRLDSTVMDCGSALKEPFLNSRTARRVSFRRFPNYGGLSKSFEDGVDFLRPYHESGLQIVCYAQGERAVDRILDIYDALLKETPRDDHRHSINHATFITQDQLQRAKSLHVAIMFYTASMSFSGYVTDLVGAERKARAVPMGDARRAGIKFATFCDPPLNPGDTPMKTLKYATTRMSSEAENAKAKASGTEQTATLTEAIKGLTINSAWACFMDHLVGSLEVGKLADLVMLDKNPYKVPLSELDEINVLATYKSGKKIGE